MKVYASLVHNQGPKVSPSPQFLPHLNILTNSTPTSQQPDTQTSFLVKNYDENARHANRDSCNIFCISTDASVAPRGPVGPLGSSPFSLPKVERVLAEMEGSGADATLALALAARKA